MTDPPGNVLHWTATAERVYDDGCRLIAEDDNGELLVPSTTRKGWWDRRLDLRNPTHWLPYLRSRLTNRIAWVEAPASGDPGKEATDG